MFKTNLEVIRVSEWKLSELNFVNGIEIVKFALVRNKVSHM